MGNRLLVLVVLNRDGEERYGCNRPFAVCIGLKLLRNTDPCTCITLILEMLMLYWKEFLLYLSGRS